MNHHEGHAHGYGQRQSRKASEQTKDQQPGTQDFGKDRHAQADLGGPQNDGKFFHSLVKIHQLTLAMQPQHGPGRGQPQDEQSQVDAGRNEIEAEEGKHKMVE